ncbi:hypothetical protein J6590_097081 [Homalodisca vitripennis]|nr:hypothetical protein J6590_097081 [Homalodisca vitripennis]
MNDDMSDTSSISDLFGENSEDDYVPPITSEDSDEGFLFLSTRSDVTLPASNSLTLYTPKKKPKKVFADPKIWKCNVRKQKHQSGESYISRRGRAVRAKAVKNHKDCFKYYVEYDSAGTLGEEYNERVEKNSDESEDRPKVLVKKSKGKQEERGEMEIVRN